ncbi:MAG: hypothetical protein M1816_004452 [Peltula sp. TS41687]|nr:MAG: hypothetical protein M1816_004452 [Peltula sp. TS41687]
MSGPKARLSAITAQILPTSNVSKPPPPPPPPKDDPVPVNRHTLSPTHFLPRTAAIEPDTNDETKCACAQAEAIYHLTANDKILRRTYQEFADRARGLAYYIRKQGYRRVGILCPNTPAFLEAVFGTVAGGAIYVGGSPSPTASSAEPGYLFTNNALAGNRTAVNYRLKQDDIEYIFDHAEVDAVIVDAELEHLLEGYRATHPNTQVLVDTDTDATEGPFDEAVLEGLREDVRTGGRGWDGLNVQVEDEEATIALGYTSGTTARPKGVEHTHRGMYMGALANLIESGLNLDQHGSTGRCRYLWTLPMFHAGGWTFPWAVTAVRGTHYCLRKIEYGTIWRLLKEERITHYCAAPTVNTLLCNHPAAAPLSHPVRVIVAASPPSPSLFEHMTRLNLHPVHVYGMTETYGPITRSYHLPSWEGLPAAQRFRNMARQGHGFITSLPVRVIRRDTGGGVVDVVKDGKEIGEIVFQGNICAKGYYRDPEATRKLFKGGVLHSGDLAVWHPDGAVQILDREKDIIISGGENISSVALESMLVTHPDILEAGVVAIPDSRWGERPKAFITVKDEAKANITGEQVVGWAKGHSGISGFMLPREVEIVKELPRTNTGKVRKNVLREWARGGVREVD